jgi:endonuclease YncB( thermonuclease family)
LGLAAVVAFLVAEAGAADEWLVYIDGGLEPVEGGWTERRGQVIFTRPDGMLVSVRSLDVDLAASAFITWQLGGRREAPPRPELPQAEAEPETGPAPECVAARVVGLRGAETLDVLIAGERETVHVACLDAPESRHRHQALGWFGRATESAVEIELGKGAQVCLTEHVPPQQDGQDHRIVYVTLADGRDYTEELIAGGLGLLRFGPCSRAAEYRQLENRAIAEERGLWGPRSAEAAFAATSLVASTAGTGAGSAAPPARKRPRRRRR